MAPRFSLSHNRVQAAGIRTLQSTLLKADTRTARVNGFDVATQAADVRESVSLTGQFAAVDEILSGRENLVADLELQALLSAGDLTAATRQLHAIHQQNRARAAADPANTQWQRDLSVSHERLGDVARAAGDLAAARAAYQAGLDIRTRLAAADPANIQWQRDLSVSHNKLGDVARDAGDLAAVLGVLRPDHGQQLTLHPGCIKADQHMTASV